MTQDKYDALVFIGRFSPFHKGHEHVVREALKKSKAVIVLVGSANEARNIRNPWTFEERREMILANFVGENVIVKPLQDYPYDDNKWKASVRATVESSLPWSDRGPKVALVGHSKDKSSYYLGIFPDWDSVEVSNYDGINATNIRDDYFKSRMSYAFDKAPSSIEWRINLSVETLDFIINNPLPQYIIDEYLLIGKYKKAWADAPHPPTFVTVDAVVVQAGHVLLVKRKASPGAGLWALPGGFLEQDERLLDGAIRELNEETKIKVPSRVLKRLAKRSHVFDSPFRSTRGRTITHAFFIEFDDDGKLPKVTGSDDAEKAAWVPFNQVKRELMMEDHFHIIDYFTNIG